ncbi:Thioredoxin domain [Trinorchestia longiramus]|nr:Thioredoxin domain [Trinorchestia longiramus]
MSHSCTPFKNVLLTNCRNFVPTACILKLPNSITHPTPSYSSSHLYHNTSPCYFNSSVSSTVLFPKPLKHHEDLPSSRRLHISPKLGEIYTISTEDEFEQKVMKSSVPVVVNFHAEWCEPCHALKPLLEGLAEKFKGRFHLAEVKVDDHVALLHAFEVTAVPAVLGVVSGQVKEKFVGLISEAEVKAFVNTMIGE